MMTFPGTPPVIDCHAEVVMYLAAGYREWGNLSISFIETGDHFVKDLVTNMGDL